MVYGLSQIKKLTDQFLRLAKYLSKFTKKNRLRLVDHTFIVLAGSGLLITSYLASLKSVAVSQPANSLAFSSVAFLVTVGCILIAMVTCEYTIRKLIY